MSVTNLAKKRGTILDEIMSYHRQRLPRVMREVPLADLRALTAVSSPPIDFCGALRAPGVTLIAECKKASPSKGLLVPDYHPVSLATKYARAGAGGISVLTDGRHFQGSLSDLRDVKEAVASRDVPVLRKDFIFHPYQVYEARAAGADALLLIAAVLSDQDLRELLGLTQRLGMNALVEVHTSAELQRVLPIGPQIIGVNNRNLQTFAVDFDNTARLRDQIPAGILVVAESGLKNEHDVRRMAAIGIDAILVGETLVRSKDPYQTAAAFVQAGKAGSA